MTTHVPTSSAAYVVMHYRCRACGRGYFDVPAVLLPTCPTCGASDWQTCAWDLSISGVPAVSAVARITV